MLLQNLLLSTENAGHTANQASTGFGDGSDSDAA